MPFVPGVGFTELLPQFAEENPNQFAVGSTLGSAPATPTIQSPERVGFIQNLLQAMPALAQALTAGTNQQLSGVASTFALTQAQQREREEQRIAEENRFERARADRTNERREDITLRAKDKDQALKLRKDDISRQDAARQEDNAFRDKQFTQQVTQFETNLEQRGKELELREREANVRIGDTAFRQQLDLDKFEFSKDLAIFERVKGQGQALQPLPPLNSLKASDRTKELEAIVKEEIGDPTLLVGDQRAAAFQQAKAIYESRQQESVMAANAMQRVMQGGEEIPVQLPSTDGVAPPPNAATGFFGTEAERTEVKEQENKTQVAETILANPTLLLDSTVFPGATSKAIKAASTAKNPAQRTEAIAQAVAPLLEVADPLDPRVRTAIEKLAAQEGIQLSRLEVSTIIARARDPQGVQPIGSAPLSEFIGGSGGR